MDIKDKFQNTGIGGHMVRCTALSNYGTNLISDIQKYPDI